VPSATACSRTAPADVIWCRPGWHTNNTSP
jgi:hypothetical protein